jgi:hypothetical protein
MRAARWNAAVNCPPKPRVHSSCISAAVAVKKPMVSSEGADGSAPSNGISRTVGVNPQMPHEGAGRSRARSLRADGEGDHAGSHGGGGARGTSSGSVAGQARIARRSRIEGGEGRGPRLAEQHGAAAAQAGDHVRVEIAFAAFVEPRAVLGGESAGLEDILHAEWNAVEQAIPEGVARRDFHPGADIRFADCDAAQTDRQQIEGCLLARFQGLEEFEEHYIDQSSLKKPACTIFPGKRASGGTVMSTIA